MTTKEILQLRYLQLLKEVEDLEKKLEEKKRELKISQKKLESNNSDDDEVLLDDIIKKREIKKLMNEDVNRKNNFDRGIY